MYHYDKKEANIKKKQYTCNNAVAQNICKNISKDFTQFDEQLVSNCKFICICLAMTDQFDCQLSSSPYYRFLVWSFFFGVTITPHQPS